MEKVNVAIATDYGCPDETMEDLRELLLRVGKSGISHIHWCQEWDGEYLYSPWEMKQIRQWMIEAGLKAKGLHASKGSRRDICIASSHFRKDYTSDWEYNRQAGVELIQNRVDLASCIGAEEIVLHLYQPFMTFRNQPGYQEVFYTQVEKSLDQLQPYCQEKGVRICLENLFDVPKDLVLYSWDRLFAKYPADFLGVCIDAGHGYMVWGDGLPEIIKKYGQRIFAVHLHDNNGSADFHQIPGEGDLPWKEIMGALKESAYSLPLVLELSRHGYPEQVFLEKAKQAGEWLTELYHQA